MISPVVNRLTPQAVQMTRSRYPLPKRVATSFGFQPSGVDHVSFGSHEPQIPKGLAALKIPYRFTLYDHQSDMKVITTAEAYPRLSVAPRIALGDLHGSYIKLLETLAASHLVSMEPQTATSILGNEAAIEKLIESDPLLSEPASKDKMWNHAQLMEDLFEQVQWTGGDRQLLLIGDIIGDRGPLDYLTMKLMNHLNSQEDPERVVYVASNHDYAVYEAYTNPDNSNHVANHEQQMPSFLRTLSMARDDAEFDQIREMYHQFLKRGLLTFYNPQEQTWYTHVPVRTDEVKTLVERVNQYGCRTNFTGRPNAYSYSQLTIPVALTTFFQDANHFYQDHIERGFAGEPVEDEDKQAILDFVWARQDLDSTAFQPFRSQGVKHLIHGHTDVTKSSMFSRNRPQQSGQDKGGSVDPAYEIVNLNNTIREGLGPETLKDMGVSSLYVESHAGNRGNWRHRRVVSPDEGSDKPEGSPVDSPSEVMA